MLNFYNLEYIKISVNIYINKHRHKSTTFICFVIALKFVAWESKIVAFTIGK